MGQGLQVWDASGTLVVDTSVSVLRDFVVTSVSDTTTATQTISIAPPANTTAVITNSFITTGSDSDIPPETNYNGGTGNLEYKWNSATSAKVAALRALAY